VVIGTGATILGPIRVGDGANVGAGSVVVKPVPPESTVVGIPGRTVEEHRVHHKVTQDLEHGRLPDPVLKAIDSLKVKIEKLEKRVKELEK